MHGNLRRRHHEADPWLPSALGGEELQRDEPARLPRGHVGDASLQHGGVSHLDGVDPVDQVHQDMRRWQEGQDEVSALSVVFFWHGFFKGSMHAAILCDLTTIYIQSHQSQRFKLDSIMIMYIHQLYIMSYHVLNQSGL